MELSQFGLFEYTPYFALAFDLFLCYSLIKFIYFRSVE